MKFNFLSLLVLSAVISSCTTAPEEKKAASIPLNGTWTLISATTVEKGKSTITDFTKGQRMIKIINDAHFAFLRHDLKLNKEGKNNFDAGGGRYTLAGDQYTEFLDYYSDKNWEGKTFKFTIRIQNDTLIQTGIEQVEAAGVDRTITERYIREKTN